MNHTAITWGARLLFGIPFLLFGGIHFMAASVLAPLVPGFFPGTGTLWVYLTGLVFALVAVAILSNRWAKEAALLLAFQLLVFVVTIWLPQLTSGDQLVLTNLLKDTALAGGALAYAALAHTTGRASSARAMPTA